MSYIGCILYWPGIRLHWKIMSLICLWETWQTYVGTPEEHQAAHHGTGWAEFNQGNSLNLENIFQPHNMHHLIYGMQMESTLQLWGKKWKMLIPLKWRPSYMQRVDGRESNLNVQCSSHYCQNWYILFGVFGWFRALFYLLFSGNAYQQFTVTVVCRDSGWWTFDKFRTDRQQKMQTTSNT